MSHSEYLEKPSKDHEWNRVEPATFAENNPARVGTASQFRIVASTCWWSYGMSHPACLEKLRKTTEWSRVEPDAFAEDLQGLERFPRSREW